MFKRLKRWFKNEPNSKLTMLEEEGTYACLKLRHNGTSVFCETAWGVFMQDKEFYYCAVCIFGSEHPHQLPKLIKDLEQINEQTRRTTSNITT